MLVCAGETAGLASHLDAAKSVLDEEDEVALAVVAILSLLLPLVPSPVLHMRVEDLATVFGKVLADNVCLEVHLGAEVEGVPDEGDLALLVGLSRRAGGCARG